MLCNSSDPNTILFKFKKRSLDFKYTRYVRLKVNLLILEK